MISRKPIYPAVHFLRHIQRYNCRLVKNETAQGKKRRHSGFRFLISAVCSSIEIRATCSAGSSTATANAWNGFWRRSSSSTGMRGWTAAALSKKRWYPTTRTCCTGWMRPDIAVGIEQLVRRKIFDPAWEYSHIGVFRQIFLPGEAGICIPDPRIFKLLLERTGLRKETHLFIEDSPANIAAARSLGGMLYALPMRGILKRNGRAGKSSDGSLIVDMIL